MQSGGRKLQEIVLTQSDGSVDNPTKVVEGEGTVLLTTLVVTGGCHRDGSFDKFSLNCQENRPRDNHDSLDDSGVPFSSKYSSISFS